ncbi:MAG TPA: Rieske 2Fe-2S domain-containing protein, partial [Caulobacteraceae bacterium]|nr:Rieske 2Fe-2S domain-containing protein [Caulobacteraceae bacterium]
MAAATSTSEARDLSLGVPLAEVVEGQPIAGQVNAEPVLLSRLDGELHAIGGACTHYGGPLSEGLIAGETVRCPWHHACFSLKTGEALAAPAFAGVDVWQVEFEGDQVFVRRKADTEQPKPRRTDGDRLERVLIVGGGAAGFAAAEMLRRSGY